MGTETLRKVDAPTRLEIVLYRLFQIRLGADYPAWVEEDVASGRYMRLGALWRMIWVAPILFADGHFYVWDLAIIGATVVVLVILSRSGRFLWKANRVSSALFLQYQRGEITRREYWEAQMPSSVPWWVYAFAFSIPVVTLIVWLVLR